MSLTIGDLLDTQTSLQDWADKLEKVVQNDDSQAIKECLAEIKQIREKIEEQRAEIEKI